MKNYKPSISGYEQDNMYMLGLFIGLCVFVFNLILTSLLIKVISIFLLSVPIIVCLTLRLLDYRSVVLKVKDD